MQIVCMKSQILFPWKNKKNILNLSSAESAKRMITVNNDNIANSFFFFFFFFFFFNSTEIRVPSLSLIHLYLYILVLRYAKDPNFFSAKRSLCYMQTTMAQVGLHICAILLGLTVFAHIVQWSCQQTVKTMITLCEWADWTRVYSG